MSPTVVDKGAKRLGILAAALDVFACKGIKNTKMVDVAAAAGIGKGTIYEYFRSKEEVLAGAFKHFVEMMEAETVHRTESLRGPEEKLRAFVQGAFDAAGANPEMVRLVFDIWAEGMRRGAAEGFDLRGTYQGYRRALVDMLEQGISEGRFRQMDSLASAAILIGSMDGLLLQWIMDRTLFDLGKMGPVLADTFLEGIRAQ